MGLNGNRFKQPTGRKPCPECLGYPPLKVIDGRFQPQCDTCGEGAGWTDVLRSATPDQSDKCPVRCVITADEIKVTSRANAGNERAVAPRHGRLDFIPVSKRVLAERTRRFIDFLIADPAHLDCGEGAARTYFSRQKRCVTRDVVATVKRPK
ncbi:MAG: hypothetical protein AB7J35_21105 [Dehalococcoidia bacterium]